MTARLGTRKESRRRTVRGSPGSQRTAALSLVTTARSATRPASARAGARPRPRPLQYLRRKRRSISRLRPRRWCLGTRPLHPSSCRHRVQLRPALTARLGTRKQRRRRTVRGSPSFLRIAALSLVTTARSATTLASARAGARPRPWPLLCRVRPRRRWSRPETRRPLQCRVRPRRRWSRPETRRPLQC